MMIKLLIVDDSQMDVLVIKRHLAISPVDVDITHCPSIADARVWLKTNKPDAIVLDLYLPDQIGIDLLKELRADKFYDDVCVVILTASTLRSDINDAFIYGANGFVIKPVEDESWQKIADTLKDLYLKPVDEKIIDRLKKLNLALEARGV